MTFTTSHLACESLTNPIGIEDEHPRFSWGVESDASNIQQSAWQIIVMAGEQELWDSGKVASNETHHIRYDGEALNELTEYTWTLIIWDANDHASEKNSASFVTAVFADHQWQAKWMRYPLGNLYPSPHMRRCFEINKEVTAAYLIMSAKGVFDPYVNGQRICDDYLMPGWTDYTKRQHYRVFDIKNNLSQGQQCIGAILGEGWWSGQVGWAKSGIYGTNTYLMAELHITYADGSKDCVFSDDQWRASHGPYLQTSIMHGEHYDARLEIGDWSNGQDLGDWREIVLKSLTEGSDDLWGAKESANLGGALHVHPGESVVGLDPITAKEMHVSPEGAFIYDFGQNMAAVVRLQLDL
ncbi:MAG: alpha-L-rhamnosidase N-terminal domain-containing protein, partial [Planctomycetes bacterium]|nr:alpha-L-rhamnosidase N-terminal domain-containing protein [Planctomycetota bacterium]